MLHLFLPELLIARKYRMFSELLPICICFHPRLYFFEHGLFLLQKYSSFLLNTASNWIDQNICLVNIMNIIDDKFKLLLCRLTLFTCGIYLYVGQPVYSFRSMVHFKTAQMSTMTIWIMIFHLKCPVPVNWYKKFHSGDEIYFYIPVLRQEMYAVPPALFLACLSTHSSNFHQHLHELILGTSGLGLQLGKFHLITTWLMLKSRFDSFWMDLY